MGTQISIDNLIEIVRTGGKVKTGVDVYNTRGTLLLEKDILVEKVKILEVIKENGINSLPIDPALNGGFWDENGNEIKVDGDGLITFDDSEKSARAESGGSEYDTLFEEGVLVTPADGNEVLFPDMATNEVEQRLLEIEEIKKEAGQKYKSARKSIKKVLNDIKDTGGAFDFDEVQNNVSELVDFLTVADNPFSYLTQEICSYDDYLTRY